MTDKTSPPVYSEIFEAGAICSLEELCQVCNVEASWIGELIEQGVIAPVEQSGTDWQFARVSVVRVAKAKRLEHDLSLNPPGVALVLELLQDIDDLRTRLRVCEARVASDNDG